MDNLNDGDMIRIEMCADHLLMEDAKEIRTIMPVRQPVIIIVRNQGSVKVSHSI